MDKTEIQEIIKTDHYCSCSREVHGPCGKDSCQIPCKKNCEGCSSWNIKPNCPGCTANKDVEPMEYLQDQYEFKCFNCDSYFCADSPKECATGGKPDGN